MTSPLLRGKRIVLTGGSRGIGRAASRALVAMGANVSLVVRDRARGEVAASELAAMAGAGALDLFVADLSVMDEVRRVAAEIAKKHERIDVLVNNAGAVFGERAVTKDGLERTFATNHVAYFLLTRLLLDRLKAASPSRVVSVASEAHRGARGVSWDDLQHEKRYSSLGAYAESKLMNILFSAELARRLEGTNVTSHALHPGTVASNFAVQTAGFWTKLFFKAFRALLATEEKGARTTVHLASSPDLERVTGKYFARSRERRPSAAARDPAAARRLWEVTSAMTGLSPD
jgi:NAD(P)-dependent dehydrogenase (short-subunit alcohol dehydrogenase family)